MPPDIINVSAVIAFNIFLVLPIPLLDGNLVPPVTLIDHIPVTNAHLTNQLLIPPPILPGSLKLSA